MTREKLEGYLDDKLKFAQETIDFFNKSSEREKRIISKRINMRDEHEFTIYDEDSNAISLNEMKANYLRYKFDAVDEVYKNGAALRIAYVKAGMDTSQAERWEYLAEKYVDMLSKPSTSFRNAFFEYLEELDKTHFGTTPRVKQIVEKYPTMPQIVKYLTPEEVQSKGYNITYVNDLLYSRLPEVKEDIQNELIKDISIGRVYSKKRVKAIFKKIYDKLMIKVTPKSTSINQYYSTEEVKIPVGSTRLDGYRIVGKLFCAFGQQPLDYGLSF